MAKGNYKEAKEKISDSIEHVLHVTLHDCDDCSVLMQALKEKLQKSQSRKEKCRVLILENLVKVYLQSFKKKSDLFTIMMK